MCIQCDEFYGGRHAESREAHGALAVTSASVGWLDQSNKLSKAKRTARGSHVDTGLGSVGLRAFQCASLAKGISDRVCGCCRDFSHVDLFRQKNG
jgi:hypothetical protein